MFVHVYITEIHRRVCLCMYITQKDIQRRGVCLIHITDMHIYIGVEGVCVCIYHRYICIYISQIYIYRRGVFVCELKVCAYVCAHVCKCSMVILCECLV